VAVRDLRVRGSTVVRLGGRGRVIGPATSTGRICIQFERREDLSENRLNCLPDEVRHLLAGGHQRGAHIRAARTLDLPQGRVAQGTAGVILGPARSSPQDMLLVRFGDAEEVACRPEDIESSIAGDFRRGNAVIATRDLRVGGSVVVREGVLGSVVGPSSSDSQHRITVSFSHREDGSRNRLNCVVSEIRLYVPGGLEVASRVQAVRAIAADGLPPIQVGTSGVVLGPAPSEPLSRLLVRFEVRPGGGASERECRADDVALVIAGGFRRGESVTAAKDLRVKGMVVVKQGVVGTVIGQSSTDPGGRVTVAFAHREDGRCNNLNVVPLEIRKTPCTGGLLPGDRVAALRQLLVIPRGTPGMVMGPSCSRSSRVAVRFNSVEDGEEVVLHVEPGDLSVLHAVGEDADDSCLEGDAEDLTEEPGRSSMAGGYGRGDSVTATRDLCVGGNVVVRAGVFGTVIGPSVQDPECRITVAFAWREDGKTNNLNVVLSEIRPAEPRSIAKGELCAICLGEMVSEDETGEGDGEGIEAEEMDICHMPCGHVLHAACVRAYLNHQTGASGSLSVGSLAPLKAAQCPVCRREMLP